MGKGMSTPKRLDERIKDWEDCEPLSTVESWGTPEPLPEFIDDLIAERESLKRKLEIAMEALRVYADVNNWEDEYFNHDILEGKSIAQKALKEFEE